MCRWRQWRSGRISFAKLSSLLRAHHPFPRAGATYRGASTARRCLKGCWWRASQWAGCMRSWFKSALRLQAWSTTGDRPHRRRRAHPSLGLRKVGWTPIAARALQISHLLRPPSMLLILCIFADCYWFIAFMSLHIYRGGAWERPESPQSCAHSRQAETTSSSAAVQPRRFFRGESLGDVYENVCTPSLLINKHNPI